MKRKPSLLRALLFAVFGLTSVFADQPWTLDRALDHLGDHNPDLRVARLRIEKAEAQLAEARAQWLPKVTAETGYSATDSPTQAFIFLLNQRQLTFGGDFNDPATTDNFGSELRLEYPLFTGGARKAGVAAAESGVEAARFEQLGAQQLLEAEVAKMFFQIERARGLVGAAEASLTSQQSNLKDARSMVEGGKALQTAVLDLETEVARAEANLAAASNQVEIGTAMVATLLGLEETDGFRMSTRRARIFPPGAAEGERQEMLALARRLDQAKAGVTRAQAARKPMVAAFGAARHDQGFTESDGGDSWIAGVTVRMNVWRGGETKAQIAQAEADLAIIEEQIRRQQLQIDLEGKIARLNLETARTRIELAEKAVTSAEKSLDLTRKRFQEGLALSTQLIDAETALTAARVRLTDAQAARQIALTSLRHALGLPILNPHKSTK